MNKSPHTPSGTSRDATATMTDALHEGGYLTSETTDSPQSKRRTLTDAPRGWPHGRPDEAIDLVIDLILAVARLISWCVTALARLLFLVVQLSARGLSMLALRVSQGKLGARAATVIGWILIVIIVASTLATLSITQHWRLPIGTATAAQSAHKNPIVLYVPPPPACVTPRTICAAPTETLDGQPSISATGILTVLQHYHSPAATLEFATALYDLGIKYGVNPAYALGFFIVESQCGTQGQAATSHSVGNIRYNVDLHSPVSYTDQGGYRSYASWSDGAADWFWVIRTYYLDAGVRDIYDVTPIYAPSSDHNDPQNYAQTVYQDVLSWNS